MSQASRPWVPAEEAAGASDFETFFLQHYHGLLKFLRRRTATAEDAEDLAQECYARMLRYGYVASRPIAVWRALLYRVAASLASNLARTQQTHHAAQHQPLDRIELPSPAPSPEGCLVARQELEQMLAVLRDLPPRCRQVFLLSRVQELSYPQIAAHCGISVKAVEKHMSKALAHFRERVGRERLGRERVGEQR